MKKSSKVELLLMRFILFVFFLLSFSNLFSQLGAKISFDKGSDQNEQILIIRWSEEEEAHWLTNNKDRLDIMAVGTDLISSSLPTSDQSFTSFSFDLQEHHFIEMLLEVQMVADGETIIIKEEGSGKILFSSDGTKGKKILIPPFDPATTLIQWIVPTPGTYQSIFTIRRLYLHDSPFDRGGPTIGFGTAMTCHPNAACKQDSMLKLISNSAVRIRMVMDEGIGWCTGSFINNARNDKAPYILTAHHCTFEYTPQYDLWRFDLEYKSDSCANPAAEPLVFSMTGCDKKAGGQASDFLLLLLNENPPSNQQITFAGWNRDDVSTPDTTYLIHHPNADIRKLSTNVNKAVIHPNQIGWSEGYTTPAHHHFRFKFTEGGHQAGSSGGPVFDQNGLIVAQLHGGSLGCEGNNAYTGRLSKSWNLGPVPAERLKDWLDPDDTGISQLTSIENISNNDLADIHGIVLDPLGNPIRNVSVTISGSITDTIVTNAEGQFYLNGVNRNGQYHLVPEKNDHQNNGLNAFDLIAIQKHLLAKDTFDFAWQHIAADATNNNAISVGDIIVILRLLLGKISFFPSSPSWRFVPSGIDVDTIPAGEPLQLQLMGIKTGDVDGSADPGK